MNRIVDKTPFPQGGVLQVFDRSGHILGRSPEPEKWIGKTFFDAPVFSAFRAKGEGTAEIRGADSVRRLYAFSATRNGPEASLFVSVGIPASVAYAETKHILAVNLSVLVVVAVLAVIVAWVYANQYVLHPIKALAGTTKRVAAAI